VSINKGERMRRIQPWLVAITIAAGLTAQATTSAAQPRDHRTPPTTERDHRAPPPGDVPREAPPPPRDEHVTARTGFAWVSGRWDWRGGKWEWLPGHWERERPGKRWSPGRWDRQGDHWVYVEGNWGEGAPPPPPPTPPSAPPAGPPPGADGRPHGPPPGTDGRPHEPPPPPRDERVDIRAGFEFVHGRWDWRGGKWEWLPGHWEREHPGRHWRDSRWEQRDGAYILVDGEWIDASAPPPPPPPVAEPPPQPPGPPPGGDNRDHRRDWKLDRPVVSSYWPVKGKTGSRIVIRGRNFPDDTVVVWNGSQIAGAKVDPDRIVVAVPPGATSGLLALRTGRHRELTVGSFEVANYDAEAEARRVAEEDRKRAEQAWAERQKQLAKDRAARQAAIEQHHREFAESRERRREDREREIRARWEAAFLSDPDTQAELTLHAQRVAELARMREVAELSANGKLVVRIGVAQSKEDERHQARMTALHDGFGRKP
jgi:hypothetical protein